MKASNNGVDLRRSSEAHILIQIEQLVQQACLHDKAIGIAPGLSNIGQTILPSVMRTVVDKLEVFLSIYNPGLSYGETVQAFWNACEEFDFINAKGMVKGAPSLGFWMDMDRFRLYDFLYQIRRYATSQACLRKKADRLYESKQNLQSINDYVDALRARYSKLLVVRTDLHFDLKSLAPLSISNVYLQLDKVLEVLKKREKVFENAVGNIWRVEQGNRRGYHIHLVVFYNGQLAKSPEFKSHEIGSFFQWDIMGGSGWYYSPHDDRKKFKAKGKYGLGMAHHANDALYENVMGVAGYLADPEKQDQYLRAKPMRRRALGMGLAPTISIGRGRPRNQLPTLVDGDALVPSPLEQEIDKAS